MKRIKRIEIERFSHASERRKLPLQQSSNAEDYPLGAELKPYIAVLA